MIKGENRDYPQAGPIYAARPPRVQSPEGLSWMITKELKRVLSEEERKPEVLPWWMGLTTIERAKAISAEIEGRLSTFSEENRQFREAFRRLGFAGHKDF